MTITANAYVIGADQYSAAIFRRTLQAQLGLTGVVYGLGVTAPGAAMEVRVAAGVAMVPGTTGSTAEGRVNPGSQAGKYPSLPLDFTSQGSYCAENTGSVSLAIASSNGSFERIDLVCLSVEDNEYSGSGNQAKLSVVTGTPAASPEPPAPPASCIVLAEVKVPAKVTEVKAANIVPTAAPAHAHSEVAAEQETASTSFTTLATPDEATIYLPSNGLITIGYQATWKTSAASPAAQIFIGANELKVAPSAGGAAGAASAATISSGLNWAALATGPAGLTSGTGASEYTGDVTTGQLVGVAYPVVQGLTSVFAAAGTYKVSVQFKASSGSVKVKNRKLWVEAKPF